MFTKSQRIWLAAAMLTGLVLRPGGALSNPDKLEIRDFFGMWAGVSVTENGLGSGLSVGIQDLDTAIRRHGDGFRICWTTLRAQDEGEPIRTDWRFVFKLDAGRRTWRATEAGNDLTTRRGVWANLRGRTLTIFGIITNEDGYSNLHIYDRTIDESGMRLDFLRTDRSQVLRRLSGRLKRAEDPAVLAVTEQTSHTGDTAEAIAAAGAAVATDPANDFCGAA